MEFHTEHIILEFITQDSLHAIHMTERRVHLLEPIKEILELIGYFDIEMHLFLDIIQKQVIQIGTIDMHLMVQFNLMIVEME